MHGNGLIMKRLIALVSVLVLAGSGFADTTITDVTAQQRYPWNGKVDISYTVENSGTDKLVLAVWAIDQTTGITNVATTVSGNTAYESGRHHIVWDMNADGLTFVSTSLVFAVSYVDPLYCVIDLSGGTSATSYSVSYLADIPTEGWSDEYKTTKLVLRKIRAGTFTMGVRSTDYPEASDNGLHQVTLTKDYWMGVFQVTQRQWELVMGTRPSYFNNDSCYLSRPVEQVLFGMIRGESVGADWPNSSAVDATSFLGVIREKSGLALDLPTEAQWEYACRADTTTALNSGKNLTNPWGRDSEMDNVGRYRYNGGSASSRSCDLGNGTAKVGTYAPNAWGLYDMHGNGEEWCLDWYGQYSGDAVDPVGCSSGSARVLRGGYWSDSAGRCCSGFRDAVDPMWGGDSYYFGFRIAGPSSNNVVGNERPVEDSNVCGAYSDPVRVDLTMGMRTAADIETITYSTTWVEGAGEGAIAVVEVNGQIIGAASGSGMVAWSPSTNGLYVLTHRVMVGDVQVGCEMSSTFDVRRVAVTGVTARQRYPWNGKVDISYVVDGAGTEGLELFVQAIDRDAGVTNIATHIMGDTAYTNGQHHIVWDMLADGLSIVSSNVVFTVSYVNPQYCVIDLSGGTSSQFYPVTFLGEIPDGSWSDKYKTTKLVLRKIRAGTFVMGGRLTDYPGACDKGLHQVTLTKDYWMGVFELTQRQWELVMGTRPSYFNNYACYEARPVERVTYNMIRGTSAGGEWPASSAVDSASFLGVLRKKSGLALDLPTDAQWEYACRADTTTALNSGKNLASTDHDAELDKVGRYWNNGGSNYSQECDTNGATAKVGCYAPNAWGLYDMHGNVQEWCLDWYDSNLGDATDPQGPSSGSHRVIRGGSWDTPANCCISAERLPGDRSYESSSHGFRLVGNLANVQIDSGLSQRCLVSGGCSNPVLIDLTTGTRTAADTETITYSTAWAEGAGVDAIAVVEVNGEVISEVSGSGTVEWTPERNGTYEMTHMVITNGVTAGESLRATFIVDRFPETPEINPASGTTFDTSLTVSMTCASEGATIHYTTNGMIPTTESPVYTKKFRICDKTTIKAIAFYANGTPSEMAVAEYAKGVCEAPTVTPPDGTEFAQPGQTVAISYAGEDGVLRYTLDGSDPTSESSEYEGPFSIDETTTVKAKVFGETYFDSSVVTATLTRVGLKVTMPVIAAPAQFTGSQQKVVLACETEGAVIRYTTNEQDPNSHSTKYKVPFYVTDSTTVKAYATKPDYMNSDIATLTIAKVWGIGDTMGKPDHAFATSGATGFVRVEDATAALGESMKSGAISDDQKSILSTTVIGPGTLTFKWKTACEQDAEAHEWDHAEFAVNGKVKKVLDGITDWIEVSQRIEGEGTNTVTWTYVKDDVEYAGEDCLWVSEYAWESDYAETQTTDVPVPYDWLKEKCRDIVDEYDNYEKVAKQTAYNPRLTVEQCYVAGLDPESATNEFTAAITMQGDTPVLTWKPDLKEARTYKVLGKETLEGVSGWEWPTNALHRFFKVTVEMP